MLLPSNNLQNREHIIENTDSYIPSYADPLWSSDREAIFGDTSGHSEPKLRDYGTASSLWCKRRCSRAKRLPLPNRQFWSGPKTAATSTLVSISRKRVSHDGQMTSHRRYSDPSDASSLSQGSETASLMIHHPLENIICIFTR